MTGEIEIFNRQNIQPAAGEVRQGRQTAGNDRLLAAIDNVAPLALQSVAGNEAETQRVQQALANVKEIAQKEGRAGAVNYMAHLYATAA
jgi:hypothetical protein